MREYSEQEYIQKFQTNCCPRCGSRQVKTFERTKSHRYYKVYVCGKCKNVITREIS